MTDRPETLDAREPPNAAQAAVPLKIVVVGGPDQGREAPLESSLEIGADPAAGLVLTDPAVSRRHLAITQVAGRVQVRDLGSKNGTFLGGARVNDAEVPIGVVLVLGGSSIAIQPRWYVREVSPSSQRAFGELLGESLAMREVFAVLERVAPTDVTVLIEGESGTGKELAARSIHAASRRAAAPYVVFDCASVPSELAESELFGHKKGAFSGATADRAGAFTRAHGGTLCLDELGELPLDLQPKLLRVIESGEVRAVGDDATKRVDVRIIAATNRDLRAEARRGRFRSDLLYRLEVVTVRLPPLRQRPEDIPRLAATLLAGKLATAGAIRGPNLERLLAYGWPGNVRELRNVLARAVALAPAAGPSLPSFDDLVLNLGPASSGPATIGAEFPGISHPLPYKQAKAQVLASFERAYVSALLERHHGHVAHAAQAAGLSRKHLYELMRRLDGAEAGGEDPDL
jgi:DNA-binding NtrC family response regulator